MTAPGPYPSYRIEPPKLVAGLHCLDFINTVEWRGDAAARGERLVNCQELVVWATRAGYLPQAEATRVLRALHRNPRAARMTLRDAIALREAAASMIAKQPGAVASFNALLRRLRVQFALVEVDGVLRYRPVAGNDPLRQVLARIALDVIELVTSEKLALIRSCCNTRCGWFFVDDSRNKSRRWCDMASCGNNAKARTHYRKQRAARARA